jgi:uncharacterized protein DUF6458
MRIGSSIALIAVGLILALAVNIDVDGLDLDLIGWILAAVGVVGLLVSLTLARRARPVLREEPVVERPIRDTRY